MEKIAQQFGFLDKAKEFTNISGQWLELSESEFKSIMQELRNADNSIREIVLGQNSANKKLKDILSEVEKNLNRREYLVAISEVVTFKEVIDQLNEELKSLNIDFIKAHYELLSENLSPEAKEKLLSLKEKLATNNYNLVKQAGLLDMIYNLFSSRARTLKGLEKRYPRAIRILKSTTAGLFKACTSLYNKIINSLKRMKDSRIKRNIEDYLVEKNRLINYIDSFNSQFKSYYNSNLKKIIEQIEPTFDGDQLISQEDAGTSGESAIVGEPQVGIQPATLSNIILDTSTAPATTTTIEPAAVSAPPAITPPADIPAATPTAAPPASAPSAPPAAAPTSPSPSPSAAVNFVPKKLIDDLNFKFDSSQEAIPQLQKICNKVVSLLSSFAPIDAADVQSKEYIEDMQNHINYAYLINDASVIIDTIVPKIKNLEKDIKNKIIEILLELKKINANNPITLDNAKLNNIINKYPKPFKQNVKVIIQDTIKEINKLLNIIKHGPAAASIDTSDSTADSDQTDTPEPTGDEAAVSVSDVDEQIDAELNDALQRGVDATQTATLSPSPTAPAAAPAAQVQPDFDQTKLSSVDLNKFKINFYNNLPFRERIEYTSLPTEEAKNSFISIRLPSLNKKLAQELDSLTAILGIDKSTISIKGNKLELFNQLSDLKNELILKLSKRTIQEDLKTATVERKNVKITIPGEVSKLLDFILLSDKTSDHVKEIRECVYGIQDIISYLINKADQEGTYRDYYSKYDIYNSLQNIVAELVKQKNIDFTKLSDDKKEELKSIFSKDAQFYASLLGKIGGALHRQGEFESIKSRDIPVAEQDLSEIPSQFLEPPISYKKIEESQKTTLDTNIEFNKVIEYISSVWKQLAVGKGNVIKRRAIIFIVDNIFNQYKDKDPEDRSKLIDYLVKNQNSIRSMSADIDLPYVQAIIDQLKEKFK